VPAAVRAFAGAVSFAARAGTEVTHRAITSVNGKNAVRIVTPFLFD
jgi:hypothetical protein